MDKRLVKAVAGLVLLGFIGQVPSAGQGRIVTFHYESGDKADARAKAALKLAGKLVGLLPGILEQFRARRRELVARSTGDAFPQAEVASLLDSTEASVLKELKKPDFAPLRDHVAEVFDTARRDLGLSSRTALHHQPRPQATLASLGLAFREDAQDSRLDRVLGGIEAFLVDLQEKATRKDLAVDLCVVSVPAKAQVSIVSVTGRKIDPMKTNGRFEKLVRGKYLFTVEKRSFPRIDCGTREGCSVNLYDKSQPALHLELKEGNLGTSIQEGWPEACRGR